MENLNLTLIITALISGILPIIAISITTYMHRKTELERSRSEAMISAAVEAWKTSIDVMYRNGEPGAIEPLDSYVLHMHLAGQVIFDPTTTRDNIEQRLVDVSSKLDAAARRHSTRNG